MMRNMGGIGTDKAKEMRMGDVRKREKKENITTSKVKRKKVR